MTLQNIIQSTQFINSTIVAAQRDGIDLQFGTDFHTYTNILFSERSDHLPAPPFDPEHHLLTEENGFWIIGRDASGTLIHTQAMRRIEMAGLSLAGYMKSRYRDFPPAGLPIDLEKSKYRPGPASRRISGVTCYQGDFWLQEGDYKLRGTGIAGRLGKLGIFLAMLRWQPDYIFALTAISKATSGLIERQGYMHSEPGSVSWKLAESPKTIEGYMIWLGQDDISYMLSAEAENVPDHIIAAAAKPSNVTAIAL